MRILMLSFILPWVFYSHTYAQHDAYDYLINNNPTADAYSGVNTLSYNELFYLPLAGADDIFSSVSDFNFSSVRYSRRGYSNAFNGVYFANIDLSSNLSSSLDYSLWGGLRRARLWRNRSSGVVMTDNNIGSVGSMEEFFADITLMSAQNSATVFGGNRRGRGGVRISSTGTMGARWNYTAQVGGRWGKDASIDGVFTDEVSFILGFQREFRSNNSLSLFMLGSSSENGLRSSATSEAFDLTDDNYYNPSWGYWDGKRRNSKVTKRFQPLTLLTYTDKLGDKTTLTASLSYRFGKNSYSALSWYDAQTPYPDYYRYMPSYADNPTAAAIIESDWRRGDSDVTQLNWERMWDANINRADGSAYVLEDRVNSVSDLQLAVSAQTKLDERTLITYGLRVRSENTLSYKEMADLLGGQAILDIDQYMYDYEAASLVTHNDIRNPNRRIEVGDRFGYNYNIYAKKGEGYALIKYNRNRFQLSGGVNFGITTLQRRGNYEKGLYPADKSYGRSKKLSFESYTVKAAIGYSLSPRHIFALSAMTASTVPNYGNLFISPLYTNYIIDKPKTMGVYGMDLDYTVTLPTFRAKFSAFYSTSRKESALYSYYDDIASTFSDMILTGISKRNYGVELGAEYQFTSRLSLVAAASMASYTYTSNPDVDILDDATMVSYVDGAKSYLRGYRLGNSPQKVASIELKYNTYGWLATITCNYMWDRHVAPNPLRRMKRTYPDSGREPERFLEFVGQERLSAAATVDIFILKSFNIGKSRLTALLAVNNILGQKNSVYSGYEQMRIMKQGSDATARTLPFPNKYTYSYGRSYYFSLIFKL